MPATLLDHLEKRFPTAKRTTFRQMIQARRVTINGAPARTLKQPLSEGDEVKVTDRAAAPARARSQSPHRDARESKPPFTIVHEDDDILVIDKPPGFLTSTVPREQRPTALAAVRQYVAAKHPKAQVGLIHRLDRDASGLLVFSKNHEAYLSLKRQFFEHSVDRVYLALVHGTPNPRSGTIDTNLIERADGSVHSTREPKRNAERAVTHYETLESSGGRSLLRVRLQTGKKHQIRAHLSERGVPIVNDPVYADQKPSGRLMLAAVELCLNHPRSGSRMTFQAAGPAEFAV
jgi:23S rRNA pseudouridine1911/1915/1917 synthase